MAESRGFDEAAGGEVTRLLRAWSAGDPAALQELIPIVYKDLRRLAQYCLKDEHPITVQATALVHDVYCKLLRQDRMEWTNRKQFFYTTARLMRRLIVDAARERNAEKRGGAWKRVLPEDMHDFPAPDARFADEETLQLDRALDRLEQEDAEKARIIELRFFAGLDVPETARVLEVSETTVKRQWRVARLWLQRELQAIGAAEKTGDA